jgi:hypothetical protein
MSWGKGYLLEQLFNVDETRPFWNWKPAHITLPFCCHAAAVTYFMLQPMLKYITMNPCILKGKNKFTFQYLGLQTKSLV